MIGRYVFAVVVGSVVTLTLLFVMHLLIAFGESALTAPRDRHMLEFVRVKRSETLNTEDLAPEKPPKPPEVPPEVPPQDLDNIDPNAPTINVPPPTVSNDLNIGGPGAMNIAEGDYLPIVRVAPVYPARALSRGIEGYVDMVFTVTTTGTVKDPVVEFSTSSLFERAAINAV
ncbi:MAG: TonB family protein, partial [Woeseiaceae bacterium]